MQIEITPELLADLKDKAQKATAGPWVYDRSGVDLDYEPENKRTYGYGCDNRFVCDLNDGEYHEYESETEQDANGEYIATANPAVMLALIAKIEELQKQIRCLEAWTEYNQDMMARDSAFKYELKVLLSLMKNSDPPVDDHKRMIEAVRELVANAKTNP